MAPPPDAEPLPSICRSLLAVLAGRFGGHPADIDWPALERLARQNGVAPLLYTRCRDGGLPLPPKVADSLARAYTATCVRNRQMMAALQQVGQILAESHLSMMVLKGASLILRRVYPDPGLRPMSDLDVYLPGREALAAWKLLTAEGIATDFQEIKPVFNRHYARLRKRYPTIGCGPHLPALWLAQHGVKLEIHHQLQWTPSILPPAAETAIWAGREAVAGRAGLALPNHADELTILLAHLVRHAQKNDFYLLRYADLAAVWQPGLPVPQTSAAAGALALAIEALSPHRAAELPWPSWPCRRLFCRPPKRSRFTLEKAEGAEGWLHQRLGLLRQVPGPADKIGFLAGAVFPSPAYMRYIYHLEDNRRLALCYGHRLLRYVYHLRRSGFRRPT